MRFLSCVCFILFSHQLSAQNVELQVVMSQIPLSANSDTIYYSKNRSLSWNDFRGTPVHNSNAGAVTASGFAYRAGIVKGMDLTIIKITIFTFFVIHESWRQPSVVDSYHLSHEQHHFDLTRIGAQQFYNELIHAQVDPNNFKTQIGDLFNKCYTQSVLLQDKYDENTNHSINITEQLSWNKSIDEQMKKIN